MTVSGVPEDDYDELIYHIPKQKRPTITNTMGASVSVYPPLGQITQVRNGKVQVTALLQLPADQANQSWEVALWHAAGDDAWTETLLSSTQKIPSTLQAIDNSTARLWFDGEVNVTSLLNFTLKFRSASDQPWRWARDEQGMGDGTIIVNSTLTTDALPDSFEVILKGYDPSINVKSCQSQCPGTRLWALETTVGAAEGEESTYADASLGTPWGGFLR